MFDSQSARAAVLEADRLVREPRPPEASPEVTLTPARLFTAAEAPSAPTDRMARLTQLREHNLRLIHRGIERGLIFSPAIEEEVMTKAPTEHRPEAPASAKYPTGAKADTALAERKLDLEPGQYPNISISADGYIPATYYGRDGEGLANLEITHWRDGVRLHRWLEQMVRGGDLPLDGALFQEGDVLRVTLLNDFEQRIEVNIQIEDKIARAGAEPA